MSQTYSYFFAFDTPNGLSVVRKRSDDPDRTGYTCRVGEKTNQGEIFRFAADLLADMEEGYTLVSFNSQRVFMAYLCKQIPRHEDGLLLTLRHVDLMFLALARVPKDCKVADYHLPHSNPAHSHYAYQMLDYIEALVNGSCVIDCTPGWVSHAAKTWNITGQVAGGTTVPLKPLASVGNVFIALTSGQRGVTLQEYYNWMFEYKADLLALMEESEKMEDETSA